MKPLKSSLLIVLVIGVGFSTVLLSNRALDKPVAEPAAATVANEPSRTLQPEAVANQSVPLTTAPVAMPTPVIPPGPSEASLAPIGGEGQGEGAAKVVRVRADEVLATVNGHALRLKDLTPLSEDEKELALTPEEFDSRLNRAIEMELTFQAAAAQGLNLTPEQTRRVADLARKHEVTFRGYQKDGITWSSVTATQVAFEQRLTAALLLQQNLVARGAGVAPASDPGVQARYEQARSEVLSGLRALANITEGESKL